MLRAALKLVALIVKLLSCNKIFFSLSMMEITLIVQLYVVNHAAGSKIKIQLKSVLKYV
jgi:hypothetical protein